jgi:hypothetical protein
MFNSVNVQIPINAEEKILNMTNEKYMEFYEEEFQS